MPPLHLTCTLALRLGRHVSLAEIFEPLLLHMYEMASRPGDKGPRGTCMLLARQAILPLPSSETKRYTRQTAERSALPPPRSRARASLS